MLVGLRVHSINLDDNQRKALCTLVRKRREKAACWGELEAGSGRLDPWRFADRLTRATLEALLPLLNAVAQELCRPIQLKAPRPDSLNEKLVIRRLLLGGIGESTPLMELAGLESFPEPRSC